MAEERVRAESGRRARSQAEKSKSPPQKGLSLNGWIVP